MIKKAIDFISLLKKESLDDAEKIADYLEDILSEYHSDDGFGTEGQCDPRGDFRDRTYSMWDIEGGDEVNDQHERNMLVLDKILEIFNDDEYFVEFILEMKELKS